MEFCFRFSTEFLFVSVPVGGLVDAFVKKNAQFQQKCVDVLLQHRAEFRYGAEIIDK